MTVYKYLGYGVTNENGVAKLDHDANGDEIQHSYTGVGAGEVDVVASLDNPVSSGSIVSETYSVIDAKHKYSGTSWKQNLSETANSDGSYTWSSNDGTNQGIFGFGTTQYSSGLISADIGEYFAFDIVSTTGTIAVVTPSTSGDKTAIDSSSSEWTDGNRITIEVIENGVKINGVSKTLTGNSGARAIKFKLETNATLTVNNLVHY